MRNYKLPFILFLLLATTVVMKTFAAEDGHTKKLQDIYTKDYLAKSLPDDFSWVPFPDYTDRAGWETLLGEDKEIKIKAAEALLKYQWKVVKATDYLEFSRSGNRVIMQDIHNANIQALEALMWGELADGKGRFMDQIINGSFFLCEMTTWALSAHIYGYPLRMKVPENTPYNLDLWTGRVGGMLSWCNYFFRKEMNKVSPAISKRIENEITTRITDAYLNNDKFWWMGLDDTNNVVNNWNPWINGNVLQCFLLIESNKQKRIDGIYKSIRSLDVFVKGYPEDGAIDEGPGYWNRAAGAMFEYLELLNMATKNTANEWVTPKTKRMINYLLDAYIGNEWVVNYNDAGAKLSAQPYLMYRYSKAIGDQNLMNFAANVNRTTTARPDNIGDFMREMLDYKTKPEIDKSSDKYSKNKIAWYPDAQHAFLNEGRLSLAIKASHNGESHNHNDVGHFILSVANEPVIIDLGQAVYSGSAAGKHNERINIRSKYHNVPMINGFEQATGKDAKAQNVQFDEKKQLFQANLAKAYPAEAAVTSWIRKVQLTKKEMTLTDEYQLTEYKNLSSINLMTRAEVKITEKNDVFLQYNGSTLRVIFDKNQLEPTIETVKLTDRYLSRSWGEVVTLLSFKIKSQEKSGIVTIKFVD